MRLALPSTPTPALLPTLRRRFVPALRLTLAGAGALGALLCWSGLAGAELSAEARAALGVTSLAAGLVVMLAVDAQTLYPAQTTTSLIAYESGCFRAGQLFRFNVLTILITLPVTLFVALPWWSLVGLPGSR